MITKIDARTNYQDYLSQEQFIERMLTEILEEELFVVYQGHIEPLDPNHEWVSFQTNQGEEFSVSFDGLMRQKMHGEYQRFYLSAVLESATEGGFDIIQPRKIKAPLQRLFFVYGKEESSSELLYKGVTYLAGDLSDRSLSSKPRVLD